MHGTKINIKKKLYNINDYGFDFLPCKTNLNLAAYMAPSVKYVAT